MAVSKRAQWRILEDFYSVKNLVRSFIKKLMRINSQGRKIYIWYFTLARSPCSGKDLEPVRGEEPSWASMIQWVPDPGSPSAWNTRRAAFSATTLATIWLMRISRALVQIFRKNFQLSFRFHYWKSVCISSRTSSPSGSIPRVNARRSTWTLTTHVGRRCGWTSEGCWTSPEIGLGFRFSIRYSCEYLVKMRMYLKEVSDGDFVLVEHPIPLLLVVLAPGQLLE